MEENKLHIGRVYRHFKGNLYRVKDLAIHTETGEPVVVYEALYEDNQVWVRPLSSFLSKIDTDKYPGLSQVYRFELVECMK